MKIKKSFITNSSSTHFLISSKNQIYKQDLLDMGLKERILEELYSITSIEDLVSHVQEQECTWVDRVTGPCRFWGETEKWYKLARKVLEEGKIPTFISMERNWQEDLDILESIISDLEDVELLDRTSD